MPKKRSKVKKRRNQRPARPRLEQKPRLTVKYEDSPAKMKAPDVYPYRRPLVRLIAILPFFVGAFTPGGFLIKQTAPFVMIFVTLYLADASGRNLPLGRSKLSRRLGSAGAVAVFFIMLSLFAAWSRNPAATALFFVAVLCQFLLPAVAGGSVRRLLALLGMAVVHGPLLGLLGLYSQTRFIEWPALILGIPPAFLLASSIAVREAKVFESAGWARGRRGTDRKGREIVRPGGLTRIVTLLLFMGPALPAAFSFGRIAPENYVLVGLLLFFAPVPATRFLEGSNDDRFVAERIEQLAIASVIALVVLGMV